MCKKLVFLISFALLFVVGSLSSSAHAGIVTATYQTAESNTDWAATPQDVTALSEDGDWRLWNGVGEPEYEKDTTNELISDLGRTATFGSYAPGRQNFAWSDGVDPASTDSTGAGAGTNMQSEGLPKGEGFQVDVTLPSGNGKITVWAGTRASVGTLVILDGTTEVFSMDGSDRGNVWGLDRFDVVANLFPSNTVLTIRWILNGDATNARLIFNGVAVAAGVLPTGATNPKPQNEAVDVQRDSILTWTPGIYAASHNLFFSTDFNDVNEATVTNPLSATVVEDLDVNSYEPGRLEFDTVYYWRVDEVNAPSAPGTYYGPVWSFTAEPVALKVPASDITAVASASYGGDPNNTINEVGLDPENMDQHSNIQSDMWLSAAEAPNSVWIRFDFEKEYKLHQMLVWNYNYPGSLLNAGFKDVIVEYSLDGQTWTEVPDVPQFEKGTGKNGYKYNTVVDLGDVVATSIRIRQQTNWGMAVSGLSEVRFTCIPVWSREPKPENEAVEVPWATGLAWRAGREADQHKVYISTDEQMVIDGNAPVDTVSDNSYSPTLTLSQTYYWRVDEVNNAEVPALWAGDIWSFTTEDYVTVDDFEDYNDIQPDTVWDTWIDGLTDSTYGASRMGNEYEPFCEEEIFYGGVQSVPLYYNISNQAISEVVANTFNLEIGSDWTKGSPEALVLWFYGNPGNSTDKLYIKLNNSQKVYYNGDLLNVTRPLWWQWNVDLSEFNVNLVNVQSITIGLEKAGSGVESFIYIDEIRLYRVAPPVPSESVWVEAETGSVTDPMIKYDDTTASGGQYVSVTPVGHADAGDAPPYPDGTVTIPFTVEGGTYTIRFRIGFPGGDDSCWVRIPDATITDEVDASGWIEFNDIPTGNYWHWSQEVKSEDQDGEPPVVFTIPAGTHNLEISYRGADLRFDAILITRVEVDE
jgi:hypothetical protein